LWAKPIIVIAPFANANAPTVAAILDVFTAPPVLGVIIRKLPAPLTAPSAEHCVGQFGLRSGQSAPGSPTIYYVAASALPPTSGQGVIGNSVKTAIETLKGTAIDLQQNPYVRVKGFSVNVSIPPSLNIDFEMRDAASSSPPSTPQTGP
jgi:hypothetical protein